MPASSGETHLEFTTTMMSDEAIDVPEALERHVGDLRRLAQVRLGAQLRSRLDPSDLVQQTLLIGHARREQFRGRTHAELRGWLRAILDQTVALAARRFHQFRPERASSLEQPIAPSLTRLGSLLPGNDSTPSHRAIRGEDLRRLADAIAALPADQRIAVELYHFVDLPVAEVAERMDRTVAAVTGLLYRAGKSLRQVLA